MTIIFFDNLQRKSEDSQICGNFTHDILRDMKVSPYSPLECPSGFSWETLLQENEGWLRSVLQNRLHNSTEVDDVYQEVGLAIVKSDFRPTDRESAVGWLYQVAVRQALQYRRKAGRYRNLLHRTSQFSSETTPQAENPLVLILQSERSESIRECISQLSETDRELLILKYQENWTYQQLADRLGVTRHTIEHRLIKAKRRLRTLLSKIDPGES